MHPTQHTTASTRPHPAPGRILSIMVDNLESLRNRRLKIAPRKARLLDEPSPQQQRIIDLHKKAVRHHINQGEAA